MTRPKKKKVFVHPPPKQPQHMREWAKTMPYTQIYVTPHIAHSGAVYLTEKDPIVALGQAKPGLHVACQAHRNDILRAESRTAS